MIADTGNNRGRRSNLVLYVVREPILAAERFDGSAVVEVAWRIVFQYPDQPRDVEAVAVDVSTGSVLLVTEREFRPLLFVLPLIPPSGQPIVAREVGEVGQMPLRFNADHLSNYARNATRPTALDIFPVGRQRRPSDLPGRLPVFPVGWPALGRCPANHGPADPSALTG